ncbi:MAG: NTP/NDP exchange transporter [Holosporales bacterium]|jgi:AAA family ATP:ADP antiporter|nr:NTP/NDP exchange transporter [Holosporales bacterium]
MSNKDRVEENTATPEFSKWRGILFPVHNFELKKFLPMGLMMLGILFIYTLVRDLKDTLMVTKATGGGAETLGFIKLYGVTPAAILSMMVFVKLANIFSKEKLFYVIVTFFLGFYVVFGFILYPLRDYIHMSADTIASLQASWPTLHWVWPVIGNWSYALFYILAELWGSVVLGALFWQFANEITRVKEARRFYSLFGFVGNFGLLASGTVIVICAGLAKKGDALGLTDTFQQNLKYQTGAVIFFGLLVIGLYRWMNKKVLTDPKLYAPGEGKKKKEKINLGFLKSLKCIVTSKYLLMIAILPLAYGISINLVECVFKGQIKMLYPDANDYNAFMGKLSFITGSVTIIVMLIGTNILRIFSWKVAAAITPIFIAITATVFYGAVMYENAMGMTATICGASVLVIAVYTGFIQNSFSKGVKYSLFDSTKQMAFIPLDQEMKIKGQAAIEIIAGRGGKSGGAAIQSTLLMIVGGGVSLSSMVNILGTIVLIITALWIMSVFGISKEFEKLTAEKASSE